MTKLLCAFCNAATTKATRDAENAPSGDAILATAAAAAAVTAVDGDGKRKLFNG